jgi:hypothetical protein
MDLLISLIGIFKRLDCCERGMVFVTLVAIGIPAASLFVQNIRALLLLAIKTKIA